VGKFWPVRGTALFTGRAYRYDAAQEEPMNLTEELARAAAQQPSGVRLRDPGSNRDYVLIPAEVYDRLRELVYDDSPRADEERDALRAEALDALGWEGMDAYQDDEP
jgi:hypothetical protein